MQLCCAAPPLLAGFVYPRWPSVCSSAARLRRSSLAVCILPDCAYAALLRGSAAPRWLCVSWLCVSSLAVRILCLPTTRSSTRSPRLWSSVRSPLHALTQSVILCALTRGPMRAHPVVLYALTPWSSTCSARGSLSALPVYGPLPTHPVVLCTLTPSVSVVLCALTPWSSTCFSRGSLSALPV